MAYLDTEDVRRLATREKSGGTPGQKMDGEIMQKILAGRTKAQCGFNIYECVIFMKGK
jgi:hypothetical protein